VTTGVPPRQSSSHGSKPLDPSPTYLLSVESLQDSRRWFPVTSEDISHTVLGLCGEVGEIANMIKKIQRGSDHYGDAKFRYALHMEIADVYTYLILLAGQLGVDLEKLYALKRIENEQRFGSHNDN